MRNTPHTFDSELLPQPHPTYGAGTAVYPNRIDANSSIVSEEMSQPVKYDGHWACYLTA